MYVIPVLQFLRASLLFVLLSCSFSSNASFPFVFGGINDKNPGVGTTFDSNSDNPETMAVGGNKFLYVGGDFLGQNINFSANLSSSTSTVDSTVNSIGSLYTADGFISAYNANAQLQWVVAIQGNVGSDSVMALTADNTGNVYATGTFKSSATADMTVNHISTAGVVTSLGDFETGNNDSKAYIMKLSPTGALIWFKILDGDESSSVSYGQTIAIDDDNNVYLGGNFAGKIDFDPSENDMDIDSNNNESNDNTDAFILKLSENGSFVWVKTLGSEEGNESVNKIIVDSTNDALYIGGALTSDSNGVNMDDVIDLEFVSTNPPGSTDGSLSNDGQNFAFVQKLQTTNGNLVWSKAFLAYVCGSDAESSVSSIGLNVEDGSVFVAGYFNNNVDFDASITNSEVSSSVGGSDLFFVKLDAVGNYLWHGALGNQGEGTSERADEIHFGNNLLYITAEYTGIAMQGSGTAANITQWADNIPDSNGLQDALLLQLNPADGSLNWAKNIGGADTDTIRSFAQDSSNNIYLAGQFKKTMDLDPSADVINVTTQDGASSFGSDAFVIKLSQNGSLITESFNTPIASASATNEYVQQNQWGEVDGSGSYDLDGNKISFIWRQIEGPLLTILTEGEELTFIAPFITEVTRVTVELVVNNAAYDSAPIQVSFYVGPDTTAEFDVADIATSEDGGSFGLLGIFGMLLLTLFSLGRKLRKV